MPHPNPRAMLTGSTADALASWADRAAELARAHRWIDHFEVRVDESHDRTVALQDGRLANSTTSTWSGLGVQVYAAGSWAYVHAPELSERRIRDLLDRGAELARANARRQWRTEPPSMSGGAHVRYTPALRGAPRLATNEEILDLLRRAEAGALQHDPRPRVASAFGALTRRVVYLDSSGTSMEKESVVSTLRVTAALREGARIGDGMAREAGERGLQDYETSGGPEALGLAAAERAAESLKAVSFPAGRYRVLCDNHLSGMLAHESFGHLTEHDLVSTGWSTLANRQGETLAAESVSISDAPMAAAERKHGVAVPYDDQAVQGRTVTMLERGVLRRWMHTRDSAHCEGVAPNGNGRALDARFPVLVRMRNTFFEPGEGSLEEAFEELGDGIYLIGARGGAPYADGSFMFTSLRGYLVEKGEVTKPVRSTSIHGNVLDFLKSVEMLTSDFDVYTNYFGGCGKRDQSFLHVGVGGPHVLVRDALLGGQGA